MLGLAADPRPALAGAAPARAAPAPPVRTRSRARPTPAPPQAVVLPASETSAPEPTLELGEADLSGAATAGEGGGAGGGAGACDLVRVLQRALRKDPLVQGAVPPARRVGGAWLVWNGDWISSPGQDGKGLAAVREAILWEVGFAPAACRETPMRGLVVLSLADAQGGRRIALGARDWRWSELLGRSRRPTSDAP